MRELVLDKKGNLIFYREVVDKEPGEKMLELKMETREAWE